MVEEIRAVQFRLDKTLKFDITKTSLYYQLKNGDSLSLYAINSNLGRFGINIKEEDSCMYVDWALEGEALLKGDRIIECNGKLINFDTKEEIQKLIDSNGRCQLVVIRKKKSQQNNQMLLQSQEDNQRLQHRISYLEDQVKDLLKSKDIITPLQFLNQTNQKVMKGDHVTSISISSSVPESQDRPQVFQRGNFVATIIGGKAIQSTSYANTTINHPTHTSKIAPKDRGCSTANSNQNMNYRLQRNAAVFSQQSFGTNSQIIQTSQSLKEKYHREQHKENHRSQPDLFYGEVCF